MCIRDRAALSLFWTLLALAAMVLATRRAWRPLWLAGAALKMCIRDSLHPGAASRGASFHPCLLYTSEHRVLMLVCVPAPLHVGVVLRGGAG